MHVLLVTEDLAVAAQVPRLLEARLGTAVSLETRVSLPPAPRDPGTADAQQVILTFDLVTAWSPATPERVSACVEQGFGHPVVLVAGSVDRRLEARLLAAGAGAVCWGEEVSGALLEVQLRCARLQDALAGRPAARGAGPAAAGPDRQRHLAERMESVGRLAGGIAHDLNNILTALVGFGTLLAEQVMDDADATRNAAEVLAAADRAARLTQQLLAFGRRQVLHPESAPVQAILDVIEAQVQQIVPASVAVEVRDAASLPHVSVDVGQLQRALIYLAENARDAMPDGGRLLIEADDVQLDEAYCAAHASIPPGHYVRVSVSDTGAGIPPEVQEHIFEPFFSTKGRGRKGGLGLATAYGIVKQSGGYIWVYSESGVGTVFKIYLPAVPATTDAGGRDVTAPLDAAAVAAVRGAVIARTPGGGETVLLVDDTASVRAVAGDVIRRAGYTVIEAENAADALRAAAIHPGHIDLLLTDVVMPGASGVELASHLAHLREGIRVLYMSGYSDNAVVRNGLLSEGAAFLQKPFTPDGLMRKVRTVLDAA